LTFASPAGPGRGVRLAVGLAITLASLASPALAQTNEDNRTQYPKWLQNAFFSINVGGIDQPFSQSLLQPGFQATAIEVPNLAVRVVILGREITRTLSIQGSYQRPISYVSYQGITNTDAASHHVRVNFGGVTLRARRTIGGRVSAYGEGGLGFTSRTGFAIGNQTVVTDAHYASLVVGGGVDYRVTPTWDLTSGLTFSPGKSSVEQPHTLFVSGGFRYTMRPVSPEVVQANREAGFVFPRQMIQVEYSSGSGYGVNDFWSQKVPIFWRGHAKVDFGIAGHYERNAFHTKKIFALDFGVSAGSYKTHENDDRFFTLSVYPLLRFTFLRTGPADMYFVYSLVGPTYISKTTLDGLDTGRHFTFQDFMGIGAFFGKARRFNAGIKINHYSNGNIFTQNAGVKIPLTFSLGYVF